jgi:hypothetical protein
MYLLYQGGTIGQVGNLLGMFGTNPYVHESKKDSLHRALISLAVAVEGR